MDFAENFVDFKNLLPNECLLAKIGFDTAENGPPEGLNTVTV